MSYERTDATCIREELTNTGAQSWGSFIYRTCSYDDEARWEQFLSCMKGFAEKNLLSVRERRRDGEAILPQLEWKVQQDPALENCSKEEIWRYAFIILIYAMANVL
jgi:hypothetical protein